MTGPDTWQSARLGDLLEAIEAGKSFGAAARPAADNEWGIIKVSAMTYGTFRQDENKAVADLSRVDVKHEIQTGDLLLSRANTREYVGSAVLVGQCRPFLLLSDKSLRLKPRPDIDSRWLHHVLSSPASRTYLSERSTGVKSGMRNISQELLRGFPLDVPPLVEQRRIADVVEQHLSRLDAGGSQLLCAQQRLRSLRETSLREELLGRRVGSGKSDRDLAVADVDDGALPGLPAGWQWRRLQEVADVVGGVTKDASKQNNPSFVEVPYLRVANVQRGRLDLRVISRIRVPPAKLEQLRLQPGDVLMNEGGDRDKLGRGWVWSGEVADCITQNHVFRARPRSDLIHPKLLSWSANTVGGPWCERNGKQSVNLASISLKRIRLMPVPVPPLDMQQGMVERLERVHEHSARLTAAIDGQLARAVGLRRSLLSAAFAGRL